MRLQLLEKLEEVHQTDKGEDNAESPETNWNWNEDIQCSFTIKAAYDVLPSPKNLSK